MQNQSISLEERALGAYIGLAVGDALGCTTEFLTPQEIRESLGLHDSICGGGWLRLKAGQVTDDTEMSLALGESILACGSVNALLVAETFSNWMRKKPVDIGHTVRRGIIHYRSTGLPFVPENEYDAGNGACMRSLPVALRYWNAPEEQMIAASREQSHTTHHNAMADAGTETILKMITASMRGEDLGELRRLVDALIEAYPIYRFDRRRVENPSGFIVETLQVVWQAFFEQATFESILVDVVNRGGDADTTGAIVGMLAGAHYGLSAIPKRWVNQLDDKVLQACQEQTLALLALSTA